MNKIKLQEFTKLMTIMKEYYGPISQEMQEIYWQGLKEYDIPILWQAFLNHIQSPKQGRFRPLVAHFLYQIQAPIKKQAEAAWLTVLKTIKTLGAYNSIRFKDSAITQTIVTLGGWTKLCHLKTADLDRLKGSFIQLYLEHYAEKNPENTLYFPGITERTNQVTLSQNIQSILLDPTYIKLINIDFCEN